MALLDISKVTKAMTTVIQLAVSNSPASEWKPRVPLGPDLEVVPDPPDAIKVNAIGFYLYHIEEQAHLKNQVEPVPSDVPVALTPMGLELHYLLTAKNVNEPVDTLQEQKMVGLAIKALHDHPVITDATQVAGTPILSGAGLDGAQNRLRITLNPVPADQAVHYWTAGNAALRLATFYRLSVVLLEPEEPPLPTGRVLERGVHVFPGGGPHLDASENTVSYFKPGETVASELVARPAQVPVGGTASFLGFNLSGDRVELALRGPGWTDAELLPGASWSQAGGTERLLTVIDPTVGGRDVVPGAYSARAVVTTSRIMPDGTTREFPNKSNATPFTVTPAVSVTDDGAGLYTVSGGLFRHATDIDPDEILVIVEGVELTAVTAAPAAGEYRIVDAKTLTLRLPTGHASGAFVSLRILVNEAESAPTWVEVKP